MLKLNVTPQLTRKERKRHIVTSLHSKLFTRRKSRPFELLVKKKRHDKMKESPHPDKHKMFHLQHIRKTQANRLRLRNQTNHVSFQLHAHAFNASTGMLGPNRTSSLMTIGSFFKRKKKSSPCGPYLPGTFHCEEGVRSRTLSQASRKGHRTCFHNGSIRPDTTLLLVIAALLPQGLEPTLILVFHTLGPCPRQQLGL